MINIFDLQTMSEVCVNLHECRGDNQKAREVYEFSILMMECMLQSYNKENLLPEESKESSEES